MPRSPGSRSPALEAERIFKTQRPVSSDVVEEVARKLALLTLREADIVMAVLTLELDEARLLLNFRNKASGTTSFAAICTKLGVPISQPLHRVDRRGAVRAALKLRQQRLDETIKGLPKSFASSQQ